MTNVSMILEVFMNVQFGEKLGFTIDDSWQKLNTMPDDPPGTQAYGTATENSECFVLAFPLDIGQTMPFDNPQAVIDGIHSALADDQALIEVKAFSTEKSMIIYSIIKTRGQPTGVQYTLTMDVACQNGAFHIQGFFNETGMTGMRDATVYELKRRDGTVKEGFLGWVADPYDAGYHKTYLMNLSEREEYDTMFPAHPLSVARAFVKKVAENDNTD